MEKDILLRRFLKLEVPDNNTMIADYYTLLKIMILLIIKINDDCCIYDEIKEGGDYYEL